MSGWSFRKKTRRMRAFRPFPALLMMLIGAGAYPQVLIENQTTTAVAPTGTCVDVKGDMILCAGTTTELYQGGTNGYALVWSEPSHGLMNSTDVAIGNNYFAYVSTPPYGSGIITVRSKTAPYSVVHTISGFVGGFYTDEGDHLEFAGDDLVVVRYDGGGMFGEILVYEAASTWSSTTTLTYPFIMSPPYGAIACDDDEIATITTDRRLVIFGKVGNTWSGTVYVTSPMAGAVSVIGLAFHDDRAMISGYDYVGGCFVDVHDKIGGSWGPTQSFSFQGLSPGVQIPGINISFDCDRAFISDITNDDRGVVRVFQQVGGNWNNEIALIDVGSTSSPFYFGTFAMDSDDGFLAIPDPYSGNGYWFYQTCTECVELVVEYGANPQYTEWVIAGVNHGGSWTGSESSPSGNTDGVYLFELPLGSQGAPLTYDVKVIAPTGGVDGWLLRTCDGRMIINSAGDWTPPATSNGTASPGILTINAPPAGVGCNQSMVDFGLPLGPVGITSDCDINQLRWNGIGNAGCGEPSGVGLYALSAGGAPGPYDFQIFDPDGDVAILRHDISGCANTGNGNCERTVLNSMVQNLSSWATFRVRRGRWLNMRARTATTNFGEVCYACFEKRTGPVGSWITCPQLVMFNGGGGHAMVIQTEHPSVELWPNPSTMGAITIHMMDLDVASTSATIAVVDALGREIHRTQVATSGAEEITSELGVERIVPGIYHVIVNSGDRVFSQRWLVER